MRRDRCWRTSKLSVINVGVETFTRSVRDAGGQALQLSTGSRRATAIRSSPGRWRSSPATPTTRPASARASTARTRWPSSGSSPRSRCWSTSRCMRATSGRTWGARCCTPAHRSRGTRMCGPMQGAMVGALLYEGWADTPEAARGDARARRDPASRNATTSTRWGRCPASSRRRCRCSSCATQTHGNVAYTNMSEGIGRVLRFGANGPDVIERLRWIETVLAPTLKIAVRACRRHRPQGDPGAGAADGRRGAQPQRRGDAAVSRGDRRAARRRRGRSRGGARDARVHRRQLAVLPQSVDGVGQGDDGRRARHRRRAASSPRSRATA